MSPLCYRLSHPFTQQIPSVIFQVSKLSTAASHYQLAVDGKTSDFSTQRRRMVT